ncbi:DUF695 domain-containing protein [Catellatospora citrea]|uniref:DUF695 domain-containing protein n=1 Tax=Catellatospora citrea TaxID=53366 RepID=A0A8J3KIQ4_9ACTN|nr:DUF695 domain-containing protein [Catellatospora citrea]RKE06107.1 uncharacterized protein DUF695 [Catellatospora citrea]GIF97773.1 hypothetical protein Cci01nite_28670 [Catellatospora citrea]
MIFSRKRRPEGTAAIAAFWAAWPQLRTRSEAAIAARGFPDDLVADIAARVNDIHPELEWEFSKGRVAEHAFIVSAAGDPALRALAHRWRQAAPAADETWEFHDARQAESEMFEAEFQADGHRVELAELRYAFSLDEPRSEYDIVVFHPAFAAMTEAQRVQVAFLSLAWLLGEDAVEVWIGAVDVAVECPDGARPPQELATAVAELAAQYRDETWVLMGSSPDAEVPRIATAQRPLKPARWPVLDTHVAITLAFRGRDNGMPDPDALTALRDFEDRLRELLTDAELIAHETSEGMRTFHVYADSARFSADAVEKLAKTWSGGRAKVKVCADHGWEGVRHLRP